MLLSIISEHSSMSHLQAVLFYSPFFRGHYTFPTSSQVGYRHGYSNMDCATQAHSAFNADLDCSDRLGRPCLEVPCELVGISGTGSQHAALGTVA